METQNGINVFNLPSKIGNEGLTSLDMLEPHVVYVCSDIENMSNENISILMAYYLSKLYSFTLKEQLKAPANLDDSDLDSDYDYGYHQRNNRQVHRREEKKPKNFLYNQFNQKSILATSLAGLTACLCNWNSLSPWNEAMEAYKKIFIKLEFKTVSFDDLLEIVGNDTCYTSFQALFNPNFDMITKSTRTMLVLTCVMLNLLTEELTEENYEDWIGEKIKVFSEVINEKNITKVLDSAKYPMLEVARAIYNLKPVEIKRVLFDVLIPISRSESHTNITGVLKKLIEVQLPALSKIYDKNSN